MISLIATDSDVTSQEDIGTQRPEGAAAEANNGATLVVVPPSCARQPFWHMLYSSLILVSTVLSTWEEQLSE